MEKKPLFSKKEEALREGVCYDCQKEIEILEDEIKDGYLLNYKDEGKDIFILKCNDCYLKDPSLKEYKPCEVYSRVVGYLRPVQNWNEGKRQEFRERATFTK